MITARFPDGTEVPALGQGTWKMADDPRCRADEIAALREGISRGLTLIDTAEMYADGKAEQLVGEAIQGKRDGVFLVSKAYPQNASRQRLPRACEASLKRLGTDRLDLYLLHWRGSVPLRETVEAMEALVADGKILRWGVSNFDTDDMRELIAVGGERCQTDQILYNLMTRGPEHDLLPFLSDRRMPTMAYSPVAQGRLLANSDLTAFATERNATSAQIALAWLLTRKDVIAIPKTGSATRVRENCAALELALSEDDLRHLDKLFQAPSGPVPLQML